MPLSYYDVVVLGTDIAPTVCAALLARRGFRVLLVGQDHRPPSYALGDWTLPRAPFALLAESSPIARRVWSELGLTQNLRRVSSALSPGFQMLIHLQRLDGVSDDAAWSREVEREFPRVKRPAEDFHAHVKRLSRALDDTLARDLVWPPQTFFERRDFARGVADLPFDRSGATPDPIAELPDHHPFRVAVGLPSRLSDGIDPDHTTTLRSGRLYASWLESPHAIEGGLQTLQHLLLDRLKSHSGILEETSRARAIVIKRGAVTGIRLAGSDDEIGCGHVIAGQDVGALVQLLPERDAFETMFEHIGEPQIRYYRYTLNLVMRSVGVPEGAVRDVFVSVSGEPGRQFERQLHLQFERLDADHHNVCVELLLPRPHVESDEAEELAGLRERLLEPLREVIPFLDDHLCVIDSPHDGRPPTVLRGTHTLAANPWLRGRSTMTAVYGYPVTQALGLCAMPLRTPIKRLMLANSQVMPGLGIEGQLITGWCAAKLVAKGDRSRAWIQRGMWTRLEL